MPWRAPTRPRTDNGVTQCFSDGVVTVYAVEDTARPGYAPVPRLVQPAKVTLRYEEQQLGINRLYSGRQNQVEIERVIRVPRVPGVSNQDAAVTEDGRQYRIDSVQSALDVYPPSMDLTLVRVVQQFDVSNSDTGEVRP